MAQIWSTDGKGKSYLILKYICIAWRAVVIWVIYDLLGFETEDILHAYCLGVFIDIRIGLSNREGEKSMLDPRVLSVEPRAKTIRQEHPRISRFSLFHASPSFLVPCLHSSLELPLSWPLTNTKNNHTLPVPWETIKNVLGVTYVTLFTQCLASMPWNTGRMHWWQKIATALLWAARWANMLGSNGTPTDALKSQPWKLLHQDFNQPLILFGPVSLTKAGG